MKKIVVIIAIALFVIFGFSMTSILISTGGNISFVKILVEDGDTGFTVANKLYESKVIRSQFEFRFITNLFCLGDQIKSGEYLFLPNELFAVVLAKIVRGDVVKEEDLKITFPEGFSIYKMGLLLAQNGYLYSDQFINLIDADQNIFNDLPKKYQFLKNPKAKAYSRKSFEGFLFPDSYKIRKDLKIEQLLAKMLDQFDYVIWSFWEENQKSAKLNFYETLIIASIIEKEAKNSFERETISSVFYNRLRIGMPLAADPTIKYGLDRPTKKVYLKQVHLDTPYNTYRNKGLPPTPICNPGLDSFKAAVYPANTDYLFFVSDNMGGHIFSRTFEEHKKAKGRK